MRPIDVCHPTLYYEYPYSPAPGSSSSRPTSRACTRKVAPFETEESDVSRRPKRFSGSPWFLRVFSPRVIPDFVFFLQRPTSDTPVASLATPRAFFRVLSGARCGEGRQIVSTPSAVTRSKVSRSEVPSLDKRSKTLRAPYRSPILNRRQPRDFAHRPSDVRLCSPTGIPRSVCCAARLPLVRSRDA